MSIRKKLLIIPLIFIIVIGAIAYLYIDQFSSSQDLVKKIHDENFSAVIELSDANNELVTAHSIAKELSINTMLGESSEKIKKYSEKGEKKLNDSKKILLKYLEKGGSVEISFNKYLKIYKEVESSCVNDADAYSATQLYPELDKEFHNILSVINKLIDSQKGEVKATYVDIVNKNKKDMFWFYAISISAFVISIVAVLIISKMILSRIDGITSRLKDIAEGEGDLTKRVDANSNDELGLLAEYFNKFVDNIRTMVAEVSSSIDQLVTATGNMSNLSQKTRDSMHEQMEKVEHVSTSMNEMAATVREVSQNIVNAAENADTAEEQTKAGQVAFQAALNIVKDLAENLSQASTVISKLKEDSTSIGGILDVIRGIAEQTNLLALNAAIEAARAGEQGRGFAVVADEVRTLATRTQQSTEEIHNMIESLQCASEQASLVMENGIALSEKCDEQTVAAAGNIDQASSAIIAMSHTNTQVATAAEEQSAVAEEINHNISDINLLAQETSGIANNVADSGKELSQLTSDLRAMVDRYKY